MQEQNTENGPRGAQPSSQLGVFHTCDQDREHGLRRILEEVGVGALGAVELVGLGLYSNEKR